MSLIDQITRLLKRGAPAETIQTTSDLVAAPSRPINELNRFKADTERRAVIESCRTMYKTDPRAQEIISTLARDMVRGGFTVKCDNPAAEELVKNLVKRLRLFSRMDDWTRLTLRDGDSFLEVSVNGRMEIDSVTRKPTLEMTRFSNEFDQFVDPAKAFYWADSLWNGLEPPADAVWFAEWQIIHARWAHDEGSRYGRPLFASATSSFKRMTEGETDIAVRRKTRAGMKYVHHFPAGTNVEEIRKYREENKDALNNPWAAIADFFGTVDISTVQGDARLSEIDDVMHHIRTWWVASPVPMSLLGYGQDLNRDVLEKQKEQYDSAIETLTEWVKTEIVAPLIELEWMLHGIWPAGMDYEIEWNNKRPVSAADLRDATDAVLRLKAIGLPNDAVFSILGRFLPGIDLSMLLEQAGDDPTARIASDADRLRQEDAA